MDLRVEDVMVRKVVTVESEFNVKYAARMMSYLGISSLVVLSKGKVVGILTERDVVGRVVAKGLDPEKVFVNDVMSNPVVVVKPNIPLENAVKVMLMRSIKKLPVLGGANGEELVGMLSLTDVTKLHPTIYANMKALEQMGPFPVKEKVDFYIC